MPTQSISTNLQPPQRNATLDTLRGGFLVIMALNHIPSILWRLTQQPLGFATSAEGFVFLAGLVVGMVYTQRWMRFGAKATSRALLARAFVIYKAHIVCVIGILLWMHFHVHYSGSPQPPSGSPAAWLQRPWESLLATLFLVHQPGLLDVLPTYCGLLALTPLAIWQLCCGRLKLVLVISVMWWALTNLFDPPHPTIIGVINTGAFNFGAWQLLYVAGVICGHASALGRLPDWRPRRAVTALLIGCVLLLSACSHEWLTFGLSRETWLAISNKNNLAPLRLVNIALLILLTRLWLRNRRDDLGCAPLALLGRHSLAVFSAHCVVSMIILGLPQWFERHYLGPITGPLIVISAMALTAKIAESIKQFDREKGIRRAQPAAQPSGQW